MSLFQSFEAPFELKREILRILPSSRGEFARLWCRRSCGDDRCIGLRIELSIKIPPF